MGATGMASDGKIPLVSMYQKATEQKKQDMEDI